MRQAIHYCCISIVLFCLVATPSSYSRQVQDEAPQAPASNQPVQISEYVRKVFQDRDGDLWFGTNGDGVCRYDGKTLSYLSTKDGLAGSAIRGIVQDKSGSMWFATDGGVSRYRNGHFTNFTVANGLSANSIWSMMLDKAGTIWVGTQGGVCRLEGGSFMPFPLPRIQVENPSSRLSPLVVWSMHEDAAGNVWFGTDGEGVHRFDGKSFQSFTAKDGLAGNGVSCILGDSRGRVWLGAESGGVSCYDGRAFQRFTEIDGLSPGWVWTALEDKAGNLWFSVLGRGVYRYDGKTFANIHEKTGFPRKHVQSMLEDSAGTLWFGFSGGLYRLKGDAFINVTRNGPWPKSRERPSSQIDAKPVGPLACFARMMPGEWKTTAASGTSMYDTWHWGPGQHSLRVMTDGAGADGKPWRAINVMYWHPARKQIRSLGLTPFRGGVAESVVTVDGEGFEAFTDMRQESDRRELKSRVTMIEPDYIHEELMEKTGPEGYFPLAAWDRFRVNPPLAPRSRDVAGAAKPSEPLKAFASLLGNTFEAAMQMSGHASRIQSTIEWLPLVNAIYVRTNAVEMSGESRHVLDAYVFQHPGTKALRCLALSQGGGVYEGEIAVIGNGSLQLDLTGYSGDQVEHNVVRIDFAGDGKINQRIWIANGAERELVSNIQHVQSESKQ